MLPEIVAELCHRLTINEGCELRPYRCKQDKVGNFFTLGIGCLLTPSRIPDLQAIGVLNPQELLDGQGSITQEQAKALLLRMIPEYVGEARGLLAPGIFDTFSPARQVAWTDFTYNEGGQDFIGTRNLLNQAQIAKNTNNEELAHDLFLTAGAHMKASAWYTQVGDRAKRNVAMIITGIYCDATGNGSDIYSSL